MANPASDITMVVHSTTKNEGARPAAPKRWRNSYLPFAWGLLVPSLLIVGLVSIFPIGNAFYLSLHQTNYMDVGEFAGLANYGQVFGNARAWKVIGQTLVYMMVSLCLVLPLGLGLAHLLNRPVAGRRVFRVMILMPWVISQTVAALTWKWLVNADFGPLGLDNIFGMRVDVLGGVGTAMALLIIVNVWLSYPFATILCLAALQSVPGELHEAASVDGAGAFRRFISVTLPLIKPTIMVVAIMLTLLYFNMVTLVLTLTGGGPHEGTTVIALDAFRQSFEFFHIGLGSAYSVVLFIFNVIFGTAYIRLLRGDQVNE